MGLILCLLSLGLFYFSPNEVIPGLAPYHIQQVVLLPAVAASLASFAMRRDPLPSPQFFLMIGLWFAVVMSTFTKLWFRASFNAFTEFAVVVCMYFLVAVNTNSVGKIRFVCGMLSIFALTMAVMGILAYHTGFLGDKLLHERLGEGFKMLRRVRALGMLNDPNDFGQFLIVGLGLLGVFWKKKHLIANLLLLGPPALLIVYAIYLTGSRGAVFGLAAIIFVVVSTKFGPMQSGLLAGLMVLLMLAGQFGGGREITMREGRLTAWGSGISMLKHSPIFGVGYQHFNDKSELTAHNSFVLCFAELGAFGYFFWLALILISIVCLHRLSKIEIKNPEDVKSARVVTPLRAALFGFLVTGWFLSRTYNPTLFVLVALVGALVQIRKQQDPQLVVTPERWVPVTLAFQLATVVMIYGAIRVRSI
jgi:putative inorganic carbon (hco3(-)) transporter